MGQATRVKKQSKKDTSDAKDAPALEDRASAGLKAAEHIQSGLSGGKLRMAWSLWRASSHLRVAASGLGGVVAKRPLTAALVGGGLAAGAIYFAARSLAASAEGQETDDEKGDDGSDEGSDAEGGEDQPEGRLEDSESEEESDEAKDDGGEEDGGRESRNGPPRQSSSRRPAGRNRA